jgi:putative ABC transport system ATP-binding protein
LHNDTNGPLVACENLCRTYVLGAHEVHAVKDVNLAIFSGTYVLVNGKSGSGKTTLLNLVGGLEQPTKGRVIYEGRDLASYSSKELTRWRRFDIGFVFQAFALLPGLTARENVDLPLRIAGASAAEVESRVTRYLELVGLSKRAQHRVFELSGGEQQRVAIARALVKQPKLILADEPTGELDQATGRRILQTLRNIVDSEGIATCITSHDPMAVEYVDVSHTLKDGEIVEELKIR